MTLQEQLRLDGFKAKLIAKYAMEFGGQHGFYDSVKIPDSLKRMLDIPRCCICFSTEGIVDGRCKLCQTQEPCKGERNEIDQKVRKAIERAARRKQGGRRSARARRAR